MGFVRAALLFLFCAGTLQLASGQGKIRYSKKVLERVSCGKKEKVKRGDRVTIQVAANADTDMDSYSSEGAAATAMTNSATALRGRSLMNVGFS